MDITELKSRVRAKVLAVTCSRTDSDLPIGLTTAQAAAVLGRSTKTLHNWSSNSDAAPVRPEKDVQGRLYWPVDEVERVLVGEGK